jgi:exopolysaccharide biosynthesis polyprenyl glycosylphosphotransferase
VIGSGRAADALRRELELARGIRSRVVGRIVDPSRPQDEGEVPVLGRIGELGSVVARHRIELIVMSGEVSRVAIFDEALASGNRRPVRICELTDFYEAVFGHVPTAEINASWFQYLVHPCYRESPRLKRAIDVVGALVVGLLLLPLLAVLAFVITRDGGPALFSQKRIGERGREIVAYKLRTMRPGTSSKAQWSSLDDPRVTTIGRFLRRTHLDELPQLINVLRGEMSLVGPRPEQPEFVSRLEQTLPFYQRRHLIRPGITGWAQIRCGYAGSDIGSAWKLCHDLFYMKYRSLRFDLMILLHTLLLLGHDHQFAIAPQNFASFVADKAMPCPRPPVLEAAPPSPAAQPEPAHHQQQVAS